VRVLRVLAMTVIVLVGVRLAAPVLNPAFFAVVLALVTAVGVTVLLLVLGVDFALMWGILTFFLSFVPYVGLVLAAAPPVLLALAEFGVGRALLVIAGVTVVNILAENVLSPMMMSSDSASPRQSCFCRLFSGRGCSVAPAPFWPCP
jgi:predicted PurR-regulated permease PerM